MSLTMSQGEGVTVITFSSNPNSKWPILCQILGTLCVRSEPVKMKMMGVYTALGIVQILVGILNIVTGSVFLSFGIHDYIMMSDVPFWFGGVFLVVGIVSIAAAQYPSYYLCLVAVVLNKVSALLAMIGLALYSWDLMSFHNTQDYNYPIYNTMIREGLDVTMMICSALQLCVTLSFSVLTLKEMFEMDESEKSVEDLHFYQPLKEDLSVSHVC
ncbi:membrane-spanning 4-domains subfamily A member 12-like [Megalobrama amblycephala]|uniref:membrane-spanning 4-domains subfamily A member 12-like n=1 Tax=Megalobrama amblycephala TaxID=75352 RepID=UPI0020147E35|nr:membrane-spanning 4-domains subfamily A member 12-like [Megalobrama amblycephala]